MPRAVIKRATQKGKRLQAEWVDKKSGRTKRQPFGQKGVRIATSKEDVDNFIARHGTEKEAVRKGELARWLSIRDWKKKFKPGDVITIPDELV